MPRTETNCDFFKDVLGSPRFVLAPMVEQSELPWRLLARKYGAQLCYTPMFHASLFIKDARYRKENFTTCSEDRPLIVQFCANDPQILLAASKLVQTECDGIDLNLGCPQAIAKRGHYGAFLQDEWKLIYEMINLMSRESPLPISCKIRVFDDIDKTVNYAKMLEDAGCKFLTVHGRTRDQKGQMTGLASWKHIRAVRRNVKIPVIANGNIQFYDDVDRCLRETTADGVMIAEGSLHNPALFSGKEPTVIEMASEYLDFANLYPCPSSHIRGHLFKLFYHCFMAPDCSEIREDLTRAMTLDAFRTAVEMLDRKIRGWQSIGIDNCNFNGAEFLRPPWICQPYVRKPLGKPKERTVEDQIAMLESTKVGLAIKRDLSQLSDDFSTTVISKKKLKKMLRLGTATPPEKRDRNFDKCKNQCPNPRGLNCDFNFCRICCKAKCVTESIACIGHKLIRKSKQPRTETLPERAI